jgi:hypothetical protein
MVYTRDLKSVMHPIAHAHQVETATILLMTDVSADQRANASGIHVRDSVEVDDQNGGTICANSRLKLEERCDDQWPFETERSVSILWAEQILNNQGVGRHCEILIENRLSEKH